ncbi:MAG: leucine-rich repeat domain-containing protein, partial [Prevotellaceae bacterium]|nr:leucine-rich repeat domain-containing protein [Prevotellaceae bacterium]
AQVTFDVNSEEGYPLRYTVIDAVNRYVSVKSVSESFVPNSFAKITIPATVIKSGETEPYHVTEVADRAFNFNGGGDAYNGLKQVILPEGIKKIGEFAFTKNFDLTEFYFPSTLEEIGTGAFMFSERSMKTIDLSNTKITSLPNEVFTDNRIFGSSFPRVTTIKLPQTLQEIGPSVFSNSLVKTLEIPYNVHSINAGAFEGMKNLEAIEFKNSVPATLTSTNVGSLNVFLNYDNDNLQTIYVPIDATVAYKVPAGWSQHASKFREKVKIGPHGYTSFYLENENFEVPAGCTAYIIKTVTQQGSSNLGLTTEEAFPAGSVIPKQTGFILKGTAGSTVTYRANLTGVTEVNVTGNLLVGTATEQEISGAGYKYYLFGYGAKGQGFYHQTGRDGNSIKLPAHRAGLKLSTSGFAPAKELIFNFEDATTNGISTVEQTAEPRTDIIYDLQGRRVKNPVNGIYIVNGKKVVISK